jgi:hypothetical protein
MTDICFCYREGNSMSERRVLIEHTVRNAHTAPPITPEAVAQMLYNHARVKHQARGLSFNITLQQVFKQVECGVCPKTGLSFMATEQSTLHPFRASLDRLDNTVGYEPGNILVVTKMWNQAKGFWPEEYLDQMVKGRMAVLEAEND